jgi:hypothetical protein
MKTILVILGFMLFIGCSYRIDAFYNKNYESLRLNGDSTFNYNFRYEHPIANSDGVWTVINRDKIHLKSSINWDQIPLNVVETTGSSQGYTFLITALDSINFSFIKDNIESYISINDEKVQRRISFGSSNVLCGKVDSFYIAFKYIAKNQVFNLEPIRTAARTKTYTVKQSNANTFNIKIPISTNLLSAINVDDTLYFKKNKLYWPKRSKFPFIK